ncbi:MAG: hypothetical protein P5681_20460 [Limnospira sp. PMC 894.15]|uniref:Uncharacterized protein n=1 Tax=Limnospira fusiformis PMC 851.14 TaxID=2219512 RepID=A0ABU9ET72_LIMFS|nr:MULTISPECIES: hypothetical protein [unclassified Limnospira]MDT9190167.1 hypothetical protein [Limnospira sp. PMC 894.15]MDT9236101.1 hypothetical protein [Limnospira sp. PMC 917.15]MDT9277110.1 hypothetical protein [Limnospira sp. PMC 737.11]
MKPYIELKTSLLCSFISLAGLAMATRAIAQTPSRDSEPFVFGCGTGCRVRAVRISEVETIRLRDGSLANTALFEFQQFRDYDTPQAYVAFSGTSRHFAICSTRRVGANSGEDYVPNPDWWVQLRGDRDDYATVSGGSVHYFDRLCP